MLCKNITVLTILFVNLSLAEVIDTLVIKHAVSKYDTIVYTRIFSFNNEDKLWHVRDYYENGQIQMDAFYSSFDKNIKEEYQCNYKLHTKEGLYKEWYKNGQINILGNFKNGLINGLVISWYKNGIKESEENWKEGKLHGDSKYWNEDGELQYSLRFNYGLIENSKSVKYNYITYLPNTYNKDESKKWPLLIYLHGGSSRGNDTTDLYTSGPFDQIYRGRNFPFIIVSPQCPKHLRWSTENWFENFYKEINQKYRIDTKKIYLTGNSLGGSGTWYLAIKYPEIFAAIAPISGFTSHMQYIEDNISVLNDMPIWAFHGKKDLVVPYEETEMIVNKLKEKNKHIIFTSELNIGHWIHWSVYPEEELYNWFLKYYKEL